MCYSGNCVWENYMGDCRFPNYIKDIETKYGKNRCSTELAEYFNIQKEIKIIKTIKERKNKILTIKNKLLTQNI